MSDWDFIVVGAGSSGCVVAHRLSEDAGTRVLLLEAGGSDKRWQSRVPAGVGAALADFDTNWQYAAEKDDSRLGRRDVWPAGRMLGGGSSLNGMMFVRGHPADYDRWSTLGCHGWSYDEVLPYFQKLEDNESGASSVRGKGGPQVVRGSRAPHALDTSVLAAASELGIPFNPDLNGSSREGFGPCQLSQKRGWRHGVATAYLRSVGNRPNLKTVIRARVDKLLFVENRAVGVVASLNGRSISYSASRGVVVCAGAVASPKLLMLSGIGPPDQLGEMGIMPIATRAGVGSNLQDHAGVSATAETSMKTHTSRRNPLSALALLFQFLVFGRGPLTASVGQLHGFIRSNADQKFPNLQLIYSPTCIEKTKTGGRPYPGNAMTLTAGLCYSRSSGRIRLSSPDPADAPEIEHQLLSHPEDCADLAEGLRWALRLYRTHALSASITRMLEPQGDSWAQAILEQYVREHAFLMYHACGTCAMGTDSSSVVSPKLSVHGVDRLWVADASIIPRIPAGNINATCIMIGEKAADLIRQA